MASSRCAPSLTFLKGTFLNRRQVWSYACFEVGRLLNGEHASDDSFARA